jgi:hypothetical protein
MVSKSLVRDNLAAQGYRVSLIEELLTYPETPKSRLARVRAWELCDVEGMTGIEPA